MRIIDIIEKQQLDDFVGAQARSQFLQSWQWGEFQKKVSGRVLRLGVMDDGKLVASAKVITKNLPMGKKYFYCGRGPVIAENADKKQVIKLLFGEIKKIAEEEAAMFLRFDPLDDLPPEDYRIKGNEPLVKTHDVQPSKTLLLDLTKTEDELLKSMHQKTRYNINLAEKKGVKIVEANQGRFEDFWNLLDQTSGRDKFRPHGRNYYRAMIEMGGSPVKLFFAEYRDRPIAAALVCWFGDTATYLHGGSANHDRNVMAPYLLQWHCLKLAKARGKKYYDFHGVDEIKWPGVTRFKRGFGGSEVNYPGTFDLVFNPGWYGVYKMVRQVRRTF